MATPKIYYAPSTDYVSVVVSELDFPYTQEYPCVTVGAKYETSSSRSLDGRSRSAQVIDGRSRFVLSFRLFSDAFRAQFLSFLRTIKGTRFPFIYIDTDEASYFLRFISDPLTSGVRFDLNEAVSVELEGARAVSSISVPGRLVYKRDPLGRIVRDPLGRPQRVWSFV